MAMKGYSTLSKASTSLKSNHQIPWCHIQDTRSGNRTPQQRYSQCILNITPTRLENVRNIGTIFSDMGRSSLFGRSYTILHRCKEITFVRSPAVHIFNWITGPSYVEIDKTTHPTYMYIHRIQFLEYPNVPLCLLVEITSFRINYLILNAVEIFFRF